MTSIELEINDLRKETQEMISEDLKEKVEKLNEKDAEDFEIKYYEAVIRKLEVYGEIGE